MLKVSVILTTYNAEEIIERTINSILNQEGLQKTFELEVLVIDDCSTDSTQDKLQDKRLRIFSTKKNSGGPNKGRNIGLEKASGDVLCIADQDDVWHRNRLVTSLPYLKTVPIVTSGYKVINQFTGKKTVRVKKCKNKYLYYETNATFITKLSKSHQGQDTYLGSLLFSNSLKHILFEERHGYVDFDWVLRLFHKNDSIEVCEPLYTRYVTGKNLSLNENYRKNELAYSLAFLKKHQLNYPKEVKMGNKRLFGSMARYYYLMNNMKMSRYYFKKSALNLKTILYYITTYIGSSLVKKKFNVFG